MGNKERPDELASRSGRRGAGNEMEEAVQSEDEKDESKKKTSDDSNSFHVSLFLLDLKYIDINIVCQHRIFYEAERAQQEARLHRRACLARSHESFSSAIPARGGEHQADKIGRLRFPHPGSPSP